MKYGKVYTYKDIKEAKNLIGKKVIFSDIFYEIVEEPNKLNVLKLESVRDCNIPFYGFGTCHWQFMREVIEEEKTLMTHRQLSKWLAKGFGQYSFGDIAYPWFSYQVYRDNEVVNEDTRIRYWGSDEWVKPTLDIYERDCK